MVGERVLSVKTLEWSGDFFLENEHQHVMITLNTYPWLYITKRKDFLKFKSKIWVSCNFFQAVESGSGWSSLVFGLSDEGMNALI